MTSGLNGVSLHKRTGLWRAYYFDKELSKRVELGLFKSVDEAFTARNNALSSLTQDDEESMMPT